MRNYRRNELKEKNRRFQWFGVRIVSRLGERATQKEESSEKSGYSHTYLCQAGRQLELSELLLHGGDPSLEWSDDFKQQISAQTTELPETARPGSITKQFGEPGDGSPL